MHWKEGGVSKVPRNRGEDDKWQIHWGSKLYEPNIGPRWNKVAFQSVQSA